MEPARILVVGGYGTFGTRVAERLVRERDLEVIVAGRDGAQAAHAAARLARSARGRVGHLAIDAQYATPEALHAGGPCRVVVNASGPFQEQSYALARAAIAAGSHYVDLADARGFVTGVTALDAAAKAEGVLVVSGASSVPGLSSAVVQALAPRLAVVKAISIAISPGNSFDPGLATTASVLAGVGRPILARRDGKEVTLYGWQGLRRQRFAGLGPRWLGHVDVPDLTLFPENDPALETVEFGAGVEVAPMHAGLWLLSWLVRAGLVRHPESLAGPLLAMKRRLGFLGSDRGGMAVRVSGRDADGAPRAIAWTLVAGSGHGPYVPAIASVILARKLARGLEARTGALACFGLFTLDEFMAEVADLDIRATIEDPA